MKYIYSCNTSEDSVSKIASETFREEKRIGLNIGGYRPMGPCGITYYKDKIYITNSYSNTLSIIDCLFDEIVGEYYIGANCSDIRIYKDKAYVACGDCNSILVFDLISNSLRERIPCGVYPCNLELCEEKEFIIVSNMGEDSISIISCKDSRDSKSVKVGPYPTRILCNEKENKILVCESNLGGDSVGTINILDGSTFESVKRITVGIAPTDICKSNEKYFVSNLGDGTLSIINSHTLKEDEKIYLGGMPRGITQNNTHIYVGDCYYNLINKINILSYEREVLKIGKEPNSIILV